MGKIGKTIFATSMGLVVLAGLFIWSRRRIPQGIKIKLIA